MKDYFFTRIWVVMAIFLVRMSPIIGVALASWAHEVDQGSWVVAFLATLLLQVWFYWTSKRCSNEQFGYAKGLFLIGAAMSTGWSYLDLVFVTVALVVAQIVSLFIGLMPSAPATYCRLVHLFYRHRMEQ